MKNIIKKAVLFVFIFFGLASFVYAYELGDKVYKEVMVKGETVSKWVILESVTEYDRQGNEIHYKSSYGTERWYEYDSKGNKIHFKDNKGKECWHEYDYHPNGKLKQKLTWIRL